MPHPDTIPALFLESCERAKDRVTARWKHEGAWTGHTGADALRSVRALALWLAERGLERGGRVAILAETVPAWALCDLATLCAGGVTVGAYTSETAEQLRYLLDHAEARVLCCGSLGLLHKLREVWPRLPRLERVVLFDDTEGLGGVHAPSAAHAREVAREDARIVPLGAALADGLERARAAPERFDRLVEQVEPGDLATLIYTSGTTGPPKGVMLLHRNLAAMARRSAAAMGLGPDDLGVAFLPLAHSLMRIAAYTGLVGGVTGAYAESIDKLLDTWREVRPTVQASVPRIWEKAYLKIQATLAQGTPLRRALFAWAHRCGDRAARAARGERAPLGARERLEHALADRLVLRRVRAVFGGRTRYLTSGGAPIAVSLLEYFHALGILVLEGYGLTETSAPATLNAEGRYRFGTVGRALPGVELRIAEDGEVLVKGPGVFAGYYKDEAATRAAFTEDGWFRTGDIGELDDEGFLRITDRKKSLIITAQGKNIAPANVESAIRRHLPLLSQVYVHGDRRPYLVALLTLDPDCAPPPAARARAIEDGMARANAELARYEQVKRWRVLDGEMTEDEGLLTPTRKLKRSAVASRFARELDALYADGPPGAGAAAADAGAPAAAVGPRA